MSGLAHRINERAVLPKPGWNSNPPMSRSMTTPVGPARQLPREPAFAYKLPRRLRSICLIVTGLFFVLAMHQLTTQAAELPPQLDSHFRRPIRILSDGTTLLIANQTSGTVTEMDRGSLSVRAETKVAQRLEDLVRLDDSLWAAIDGVRHELILLQRNSTELQVATRHRVPKGPVRLAWDSTSQLLWVASRWGQCVSSWRYRSTKTGYEWQHIQTVDLDFCPGELLLWPEQPWLMIADHSGALLEMLSTDTGHPYALIQIPGHNIRGLAVAPNGQELVITHQMLNDFIPTIRDHVFWGNVLSNMLRNLPLAAFIDDPTAMQAASEPARPSRKIPKVHGTLFPLGQQGHAAGDPERLGFTPLGGTVVLAAGTGEVLYRGPEKRRFERCYVGRRPTDFIIDGDGRHLIVANRFDDSLAVVRLDPLEVVTTVPLGPSPEPDLVTQGEALFYDSSLSLHGWFSCHSCHTDGHTTGLLNDNFGDNTIGAPKRIPSLLGAADTGPWGWNGENADLHAQIRKSMLMTMRATEQRPVEPSEVAALTAYVASLAPAPSKDLVNEDHRQQVRRGQALFDQLDCTQCHEPPSYSSPHTFDVGIQDELGASKFNPPSLRGVRYRRGLFHDGRAKSLDAVLQTHPEPTPAANRLDAEGQADLKAFLETL